MPYAGLRGNTPRDAKGYARWTQNIKHVYFFAYFRRRALDAESTQSLRKSTQHYATVRHAYATLRQSDEKSFEAGVVLRMDRKGAVLRTFA